MPTYTYTAKSGPHQTVSDTMQAESKGMVIKKLKSQGLFPLVIEESLAATARKKPRIRRRLNVAEFTRQLAELIQAGIPLAKALGTLKTQDQPADSRKLLTELQDGVLGGSNFSDALSKAGHLFSSFYITMVRIGESSGRLAESLSRLADFKEREDSLKGQVLTALAYPAFVLAVGMLTVFFMVTFFIPRLSGVFGDFSQQLPLLTRLVMGLSSFFQMTWWLFAVCAAGGGFAFRSLLRQEKYRLKFDGLLLRVPLVKTLIQKVETARFAHAFGVLLRNGVPMVGALHIIALSVQNRIYRQALSRFDSLIRKGKDLSACLREAKIFPDLLVTMVSVGEESGELGDMLLRAAGIFEAQLNRTVKTVVALLEPVLILIIGGIVMVIVFAMLMPIFEMNFMAQ